METVHTAKQESFKGFFIRVEVQLVLRDTERYFERPLIQPIWKILGILILSVYHDRGSRRTTLHLT